MYPRLSTPNRTLTATPAPFDTLPALFGLCQPEPSSSVLYAFVLATLSVCMCVSVIQCPGPLLLHKEALLFPHRNSFSPHAGLQHQPPSWRSHIFCISPLSQISLMTLFATLLALNLTMKCSRIWLLPCNPVDPLYLDTPG